MSWHPPQLLLTVHSFPSQVAFKDCVVQGENRGTGEYTFELWDLQLKLSVDGDESKVEQEWCAVVGDNTGTNPQAGKLLVLKYPKIFFNGCRTHCADLMVEDVAKLTELKDLIDDCLFMTKFILSHSKVKEAHKRISKDMGGTLPKTFPLTRFAYAFKCLDALLGRDHVNISVMREMVREETFFTGTCYGLKKESVETFHDLVMNDELFEAIKVACKLFTILSVFTHHLETPGIRGSFLKPLFTALEKEINVWIVKKGNSAFTIATIGAIKDVLRYRWSGTRTKTGLYSPQYLMSGIVDPMFCLEADKLPSNWKSECAGIVRRFYPARQWKRGKCH